MDGFRVVTLDVQDATGAQAWDAFVAGQADATLYHRWLWRDLIARAFGHQGHYLAAFDGANQIGAVLPLIRLRSRLFGDFLVSMPYFNYGGLLSSTTQAEKALLGGAVALADRLGVGHMELRHTSPKTDLPKRQDKVSMWLRLPDSHEQLMRDIGAKLRSQCKRALREGARVAVGGSELLADFYQVFSHNMRDLGTPVYGRAFFAAILEALPQQSHIVAVYLQDRPVAAGLLLGHGERLEIPWASSLRAFNRYSVNMLLYSEVLRFAIERGYGVFDFGRSTRDAGTYRFKKQWGAEEQPLTWEYWLPPGATLPELRPDSPRFRLAVRAWQKLPIPVANTLGPHIVKNLP